jgi:hypothetical protein
MGVRELRKMVRYFTLPVTRAYMRHVQDNAAESVRRVIDRLHESAFAIETDQGNAIKVRIAVDKTNRKATVDFTGTSPQQPSNFNAPEPVTRAAVLYVFRVMVDDDIPMNAGCLRPIRIIIPKKSMLTPEYPAAVVAGNVETSQEVTNCLFGALGAMAAAQGTMNNLNFGNARYQYYETICSGSPAGPGFPGTDAVPHDQYAADRSGNPGIPLSGLARRLSHPQRFRWARPMERRQRHSPHHPFPGKNGMYDSVRPPTRAAVRACQRRRRPGRRELGAAQGRPHGKAARLRHHDHRRGRGDHHPDADRGRLR